MSITVVASSRREKYKQVSHDARMEWEVVTDAQNTDLPSKKRNYLQEDLENVEVTKTKTKKVIANEGKLLRISLDRELLRITCGS